MKLSIIIPVYNMEQYLEKCLDSVTSQPSVSIDDFEVIVVNDGSKDSSQDILDKYDWKGANHLLLKKENGGLSSARNFGLPHAKGTYVWFVDSDDWIDNDCLVKIFPSLDGADAIHYPSYYRETNNNSYIEGCMSIGSTGPNLIKSKYQYPVQFTIYRTDFLKQNDLTFQHGIVMEDLHFTPRALYKAKTVRVVDFPVYHYLLRQGSIMTETVKPKRITDRIWIAHDMYKYMEEYVSDQDKPAWAECLITDLNAIMFDAFRSRNDEIKKIVRPFINKEKHLTQWLKNANNRRNRIWYYLSKVCLGDYYMAYSLLYKIRY